MNKSELIAKIADKAELSKKASAPAKTSTSYPHSMKPYSIG